MAKVVSNDVSAIVPEIWSAAVQEPLYKSLVSIEVANTRFGNYKYMDTIHVPYFGDLSAQSYTPGTEISATNLDWKYDTLVVSAYKVATFYIDNVEELQANVAQIQPLAEEAAYRLRDAIDQHVFANITGLDGGTQVNDSDLRGGGTDERPLSATSAQIIELFSMARKKLRELNVEEFGDWAAVVTPMIAQRIETKAASVGFNVADATLRNGYAGDWMGFQIYISNNLPSGSCSTVSPNEVSGGPVSSTNCRSLFIGRKGSIDLALQQTPSLTIRDVSDMLGKNFHTWTVYGSQVFTKNRSRFLNVPVDITTTKNVGG